jgi:hypothetical protein
MGGDEQGAQVGEQTSGSAEALARWWAELVAAQLQQRSDQRPMGRSSVAFVRAAAATPARSIVPTCPRSAWISIRTRVPSCQRFGVELSAGGSYDRESSGK